MFTNDISKINVVPRTEDLETGVQAVTSPQTFRLSPVLDGGKVTRIATNYGDVFISQTATNEFGAPSRRSLFRVNLEQNGPLPPAAAYIVLAGVKGEAGTLRASEALGLLFQTLLSLATTSAGNVSPEFDLGTAPNQSWPQIISMVEGDYASFTSQLQSFATRLLNGEA